MIAGRFSQRKYISFHSNLKSLQCIFFISIHYNFVSLKRPCGSLKVRVKFGRRWVIATQLHRWSHRLIPLQIPLDKSQRSGEKEELSGEW